jgi:lysylphosphatidylglycerol synthetase-like protein (DUF2156 family)
MGHATTRHRPFGVSLVSILMILTSLASIIGGAVLYAKRNDADFVRSAIVDTGASVDSGDVTAFAVTTFVIGVIALLVAFGLRRGSNVARFLVIVVMLANVAAAIYIATEYSEVRWFNVIVPAVVHALIAGYLWFDKDARRFFRRS